MSSSIWDLPLPGVGLQGPVLHPSSSSLLRVWFYSRKTSVSLALAPPRAAGILTARQAQEPPARPPYVLWIKCHLEVLCGWPLGVGGD